MGTGSLQEIVALVSEMIVFASLITILTFFSLASERINTNTDVYLAGTDHSSSLLEIESFHPGSEVKGSLNDSNLQFVGFASYNMEYETFALTRLIYYVMTGKYNLENIRNENIRNFVLKGIDPMLEKRYHSIDEMQMAFEKAFPLTEF